MAADFENHKLPTLDFELWMKEEEVTMSSKTEEPLDQPEDVQTDKVKVKLVKYNFFEKSMGSKVTMLETSASSWQSKVSSLTQEVTRRLINTSEDLVDEKIKAIDNFCNKLKMSGYTRQQRWEILKSGTRKYNKMVREEKIGKRRVNRPSWEGGKADT